MHPSVYYIFLFMVLGGIGMALGNRKATLEVRRQRWVKYYAYILITAIVIISIFQHFFFALAIFLEAMMFIEWILVTRRGFGLHKTIRIAASGLLLLAATGFLLFAHSYSPGFIFFIYFQVLVFDGFSQVSGQLFGKRLLAPAISPGKTVEGLLGGWLFCIITAFLAADIVNISGGAALLFGLITGCFACIGDLLASWYKRHVGVKDYSVWLPGQGGFLDRFDSFVAAGALYYLLSQVAINMGFCKFMARVCS